MQPLTPRLIHLIDQATTGLVKAPRTAETSEAIKAALREAAREDKRNRNPKTSATVMRLLCDHAVRTPV